MALGCVAFNMDANVNLVLQSHVNVIQESRCKISQVSVLEGNDAVRFCAQSVLSMQIKKTFQTDVPLNITIYISLIISEKTAAFS